MQNSSLSREEYLQVVQEAGFNRTFSPLETELLNSGSMTARKFFYLSGGEGAHNMRLPSRFGGPQRVFDLLDTPPRHYWQRNFVNEWTTLKKDERGTHFADYYVDRNGVERLSAGTLPEDFGYPETTIDTNVYFMGLTQRRYNDEEPIIRVLNPEDKLMLALRDVRWKNFYSTKRAGDPGVGCMLSVMGGMMGAIGGLVVSMPIESPELALGLSGAGFVGGVYLTAKSLRNRVRDAPPQKHPQLSTQPIFNQDVTNYFLMK